MTLDLRSGLSDWTRIVIDGQGIGHARLAIHTKCMKPVAEMKNGTVRQALRLCQRCFEDRVKAHKRSNWFIRALRFIFPV